MEKYKYLAKNVGILTISNFASKILVFLLVPIYTSALSTKEVGTYDLVVSTILLVFPLLTLNIVDALMRFLMDTEKSKVEVASIGMKFVLVSIIPVFLFLLAASRINLFQSIHGLEIYIFLYYCFCCFNQYFIQFAKGMEFVSAMGIAGVLGTITMLVANVVLLLIIKLGLPGFFIANIMGQALPTVYIAIKIKIWRYLRFTRINKSLQKEMLIYCVPLIATAIGWWVNSAADKYIVAFICGVSANGLLSVSYKIPAIINTLQTIFIQAWQISAVKEYGEEGTPYFYGKTFIALNIIMSIACSLLILLAKPIGHLLYQNDFFIAWKYVPFLLIASVINSASGFLGPILSAKKESKPMAMSAIYGAIVNVLLNLILVYVIGIQGATIATVISSFVIYLVRKKAVGNEIKIKKYSKVLIMWVALSIQAIIEIYTKFLWIEACILVLLILININDVKEIINAGKKIER